MVSHSNKAEPSVLNKQNSTDLEMMSEKMLKDMRTSMLHLAGSLLGSNTRIFSVYFGHFVDASHERENNYPHAETFTLPELKTKK